MVANQLKNKIIIIGADHHNTLAVIRCFGMQHCDYEILILTEHDNLVGVSHSKYARGKVSCVAPNEREMLNWLLQNRTQDKKAVIVTCSDLAAYVVDAHVEDLAPYYITQGFEGEPGKVVALMNKMEQKRLAEKYGICMAKSWTVAVNQTSEADITYPCIIKPEVSAKGNKADIAVCENEREYIKALIHLKELGYQEVLVQQYLKKQYEICAFGAMSSGGNTKGVVVKKLRETPPPAQGSTLLAKYIEDPDINKAIDGVIRMLAAEGYHGLYDIEMLVCEDDIYLNEINFRSSGCGFGMVKKDEAIPVEWAKGEVNPSYSMTLNKPATGTIHNDLADLFSRKKNYVSTKTWLKDFFSASRHAFFSMNDLPGTFFYYGRLLHRK